MRHLRVSAPNISAAGLFIRPKNVSKSSILCSAQKSNAKARMKCKIREHEDRILRKLNASQVISKRALREKMMAMSPKFKAIMDEISDIRIRAKTGNGYVGLSALITKRSKLYIKLYEKLGRPVVR